jgi:hypothetical protein
VDLGAVVEAILHHLLLGRGEDALRLLLPHVDVVEAVV